MHPTPGGLPSGGPVNVNVVGAGGIMMNVARTVSGAFTMNSVVTNGNNLTLNGTCQINGGNFSSSPTYGSSSTLIYNTTYSTFNEWTGGGTTAQLRVLAFLRILQSIQEVR
jgi:hypothetical protein